MKNFNPGVLFRISDGHLRHFCIGASPRNLSVRNNKHPPGFSICSACFIENLWISWAVLLLSILWHSIAFERDFCFFNLWLKDPKSSVLNCIHLELVFIKQLIINFRHLWVLVNTAVPRWLFGEKKPRGYLAKFNTGRLRPEVQPLTLFIYTILAEKVPLLYTFYWKRYPFHIPTLKSLVLILATIRGVHSKPFD